MADAHCDRCGKPFSPYRDWQRFCSRRCKRAHESGAGRTVDALAEMSDAELRETIRQAMRRRKGRGRLRVRF